MFLTLARVSKSVLITGANEGLGFCTALALAAKNHRIIMADKADLALSKSKIVKKTGNCDIVTKFVDFTSLTCVRNLAQEIVQEEEKLDVLINNVGVFCLGKERTVDGLQATMQVNHFGPFLLTHLLADLLAKSAPSRVIFVSSLGAFFNNLTISNVNNPDVSYVDAFSSLLVYYNSKLCNMIVSNGFAQRFSKEEITFNSVHPGMSATTFLWKNKPVANPFQCFLQSPEIGAENCAFLATSEQVANVSGKFFVDFREHQQPRVTTDAEFCSEIWAISEDFVGLTEEKICRN
ncbi:WW domain-containing oxidoreductase-like Protein [Tribolium castaneum]|uniref:WW domain-containing oxidoreductase-like Protein n=2 Tax=Tribolium castaneum TaxID=7070 RepID=D6X0B4_TRICA|nr:WW domain-containing oxidoreductase-like Protein [Tribolium castaneum]